MSQVDVPTGWLTVSINELGSLFTGTTPPTSDKSLYGDAFPFISPADMGRNKNISSSEKNLSTKGFESTRKIPVGAVLFVCIGSTIGKTGISRAEMSCNQQINYLVPYGHNDSEFLYYALSFIAPFIKEQAGEQAVPMVNKNDFGKFKLNLPDLSEQRVIAKALSDIDELISAIRNEIQKKESLKKSLLQKLIPGRFLTEELSYGWQLKPLRDIGEISGAGVDKVNREEDIEIGLLNYMDVYKNTYIDKQINFTRTTATKLQLKNCSLKKGDVLFTPTSETPGDIANSSVVSQDLANTCYSYHLVRFRPFQEINLSYFAYIFDVEDFRNQALKAAEGSGTRYVITLPRFRNMVIPIPPLKIQEEIGNALDSISEIIKNDRVQLAKYECIKQGMMNDLLTGKVRLV